jgi:hypothetical protein
MRVLVRFTAVVVMIIALFMLYSVALFTSRPYGVPVPLLISTVVLWVVTIVVGPFASIRLWRFEERGRALGLLVFGVGLLYFGGCLVIRARGAHVPSLAIHSGVNLFGLAVLSSPSTRRVLR